MENVNQKIQEIIKKIISCRLLYYITAILLFIATYYLDLKVRLEGERMTDGNHLKYFFAIAIVVGLIIVGLIVFSKKLYQKLQPHIVYMIFALIIGGMYVFIIPLCAQSDEPAHLYRTFQVAKGEIISPRKEGRFITTLPKSVYDMVELNSENKRREYKKYYDVRDMMQIELNEEETMEIETVGNYHGISYLPQAVGVKIGMILKLNPYFTAMLGRISSLIITVLMFTWGIKKLPKHKLFASIVLLCPVVLSTAACYSADNMTLASIFVLTSYVLYYMQTKEKIKKIDYAILAVLTFIVAISKMAYLPVIGILIFLPKECFEENSTKKKWIASGLFLLLGLGAAIWWMKVASINGVSGTSSNSNTWIYTNPIGYLVVLFRSTLNNGYDFLENMFAGHFLCHNQIAPYSVIPITYIVITIMAFFSDENKEKTTMMQKLTTSGIVLVSYALISTAMYVYNTEFKKGVIVGVQGRYLIPLLLMAAVIFANKKKIDIEEQKLTNIALIANYAIYLTMMVRFFL